LEKNATLYVAVRSAEKGNQAINELKKATGNEKVHLLQIDLADLVSIQRAAAEFQRLASTRSVRVIAEHVFRKETKLHILINNA
jgi:NAD(P)-dependent dehydrogenase (short-subunit alcohol dehydrogenase family)